MPDGFVQAPIPGYTPKLRWTATWYVEWKEWMIGVKWYAGCRIKLGPFGVTIFKTAAPSPRRSESRE